MILFTWAMLTMIWRNLGCFPASCLSLAATGLLRVFKTKVPSFTTGSAIPVQADLRIQLLWLKANKNKLNAQLMEVRNGVVIFECWVDWFKAWVGFFLVSKKWLRNGGGQRKRKARGFELMGLRLGLIDYWTETMVEWEFGSKRKFRCYVDLSRLALALRLWLRFTSRLLTPSLPANRMVKIKRIKKLSSSK